RRLRPGLRALRGGRRRGDRRRDGAQGHGGGACRWSDPDLPDLGQRPGAPCERGRPGQGDAVSRARLLFWIVAAVTPLLGCAAPLQPPRSAGAVPAGPASGTHPGSSAGAAARPGAPPAAVVDSTPSREALEVLGTIPEPIPAAQRVRPPPTATPPADTAASQPSPPSGVSEGSRPAPSPLAVSSPPARPAPGSPRGSAASDTCWRVQVGAPTQREKAERLREAAESQLLAPMAIEREKGLFKVRSSSCLDRVAAQRLKERAVAAGFTRAFRFAGRKP